MKRVTILTVLTVAAMTAAGCGTIKKGLGVTKVTPDEFRVVSMAPLVVPPEYGLRPPAPGQPRPQELAPESAARQILLGQRQSQTRTEGETLLASRAGADRADPLARYVIDDEAGDLAHKEESFANRIMFWRRNDPSTQTATTTVNAGGQLVIDPAHEAARLQALTGGRDIMIRREEPRFKLPGL